jgi:hypothetical protein
MPAGPRAWSRLPPATTARPCRWLRANWAAPCACSYRGAPALKQQRIREFGAQLDVESSDYDEAEDRALRYAGGHRRRLRARVLGSGRRRRPGHRRTRDTGRYARRRHGGHSRGRRRPGRGCRPGGAVRVAGRQDHWCAERPDARHVRSVPRRPRGGRTRAADPRRRSGRPHRRRQLPRLAAVLDDVVLVTETDIAHAIRSLLATEGVLAEGAGAAGAAAVLSGRVPAGESTAIIISGGNIDTPRLGMILRQQQ